MARSFAAVGGKFSQEYEGISRKFNEEQRQKARQGAVRRLSVQVLILPGSGTFWVPLPLSSPWISVGAIYSATDDIFLSESRQGKDFGQTGSVQRGELG